MLLRTIFAGLLLLPVLCEMPGEALAQASDPFIAAPRITPGTVPSTPRFYASISSHAGKFVLGNSTRVMASGFKPNAAGVSERVDDGLLDIPGIPWGFKGYQLDFLGSQTASSVNRVYLQLLDVAVPGCTPCYTIHRTIEQPSNLPGDPEWVLGTIGATGADGNPWQGIYLDGNEVGAATGYTKFLAPGTPVWMRQSSGDKAGIGRAFSFSNPRLVLRPISPTSTDWQIAELAGDNTFTGQILAMTADSRQIFTMLQVVRQSDWNRYVLVPATNPLAEATNFEIRRPVGMVAEVKLKREGNTFIDAPLYNVDLTVTVKSSDAFAGMAGLAFNLNAKPLTTLDQRFSYPGFIAFVPALPERLAITQQNRTLLFPLDYHGSFPGVVFGIRGATGTCAERGMLDLPTTDTISEFLADPSDGIGSWTVCSLPWFWTPNQAYRIRLWETTRPNTWGAWIAKADGSDERQIGALTVAPDKYGNPEPQIASAAAFVRVNTPQACDQIQPFQITVENPVADAKSTALAFGTPTTSGCPAPKTSASCSGNSCTLGLQ